MLENLKKLNPEINIFDVTDPEFASFGRIIDLYTAEIIEKAKKSRIQRVVLLNCRQ